jgi:hypothetical protein
MAFRPRGRREGARLNENSEAARTFRAESSHLVHVCSGRLRRASVNRSGTQILIGSLNNLRVAFRKRVLPI